MSVPGDVKKAIELLRAQPERRLSIGKLAASCGVAPRTLQKHFKQFVGKTPAELRFEARLDRARRELLRAKPNVSVSDVAASCGIRHLGRFATHYRERFGETPSATLRRRRHTDGTQNGSTILPVNLDRPAIAVHEFTCAEQLHALGNFNLDEGICVGLMRERWFRVSPADRARYHLKGNFRHDKGLLQIKAALISAETGRCLWADRWQGAVGDIFSFQDRVVTRVINAVRRTLFDAEIHRSVERDSKNASGWELTMKALPLAMRIEGAPLRRALDLLEQAMELSPMDGLPVALAAWCRAQRGSHHLSERPQAEKLSGLELVARGARTNDDAIVQSLFGSACALAGEFDRAASHIDRALALDGSSAWAWNRLGMLDVYRGNFKDATESFMIARDLDPCNPLNFMSSIGIGSSYFDAERYEEGAGWFGRAIAEHPAAVWVNRFRAPALLLAGKKDEAGKAFVELTKKYPDLTIKALRQAIPYRQNHWDRLAEGLVDLGMPL
jgi:AraC-like DNA-binding protein